MIRKIVSGLLALALFAAVPAFADSFGSAVGGQAGNQSSGAGCINQAPTLSSGQQATIRCSATGALVVDTSGGSSGTPYQETYLGNQTALTLASSTALTPTATATIADIVVESNTTYNVAVRCLADGTAPTTSTGLELQPGATWHIVSAALASVKCIQEGASAAIDVQYGK